MISTSELVHRLHVPVWGLSKMMKLFEFSGFDHTEQCFITHSENSFSFNFGWDIQFSLPQFLHQQDLLISVFKDRGQGEDELLELKKNRVRAYLKIFSLYRSLGPDASSTIFLCQVRLKSGWIDNYIWIKKLVSLWVRRAMVVGHALSGSGQQVECCSDTC